MLENPFFSLTNVCICVFVHKKKKKMALWVSHWIILSTDSFQNTELFRKDTSKTAYFE